MESLLKQNSFLDIYLPVPVCEPCRGRRDMADKESYILLWDMLIQLLRQKGQVKGSDLAELLLKDSRVHGDL